jgi:alpha-D-xyloside xylohydrolase
MKFTDGYWLVRKGAHPQHPVEVRDVEASSTALTVFAPAKHIAQRGDTLNIGLFTVEFTAPLPDVVRVRVTRFAGQPPRPPHFPLHLAEDASVQIEVNADHASLTSGRLTVRVPRRDDWRVEFLADGHLLTQSGFRGLGSVEVDGEGHFMHEQLQLGVGECVYGLGERFTAFVKNGQAVDIWNRDGGTASEQAYKNVPFYLTNRGYGVFVNDPGPVSFEVASEKVARVQFSVPGQALDYFVIYGPTPKEVLEKYTALTGRPALPPAWSFGLWLSTSFTTTYDEATVTSFIQGMADRDLPLHVFHFDCFWMREFHWSNLAWDTAAFPDPAGMLQRLKARGLRICLWINPYIAQRSALFAEGMQNGYLLKRADGTVWQTDLWQAGMGLVDFTNPAARDWFTGKLRVLLDQGVDTFKTDFGERIPTDVVYHDGSDPVRMHNFYTYLYNRTVFDLLREVRGEGEAVVFARSATVGGQQFPVHWGGDCESTFAAMAETLRGGLSLGLCGFGFWSHDIGGFEGTPPAAVYKRWLPFGLLSSHSRLHGSQSYRVPWLFDDEAVAVLRRFTELKCRLMPYLYAQAVESARRGVPVLRAMLLEFPDDPGCDYLDRQYMLGESLLVAPVFSAEGEVTYYVPAGRWTSLLTGAALTGPGWVRETHDFASLPVLVRPNTVLTLGNRSDRPDYDFGAGVTLAAYELAAGYAGVVTVPTATGAPGMTFHVSREGAVISVRREGSRKQWQLLLVGVDAVAAAEGGDVRAGQGGTLVAVDAGQDVVRLTVAERA